jgi:hypothetical protein
MMALSPTWVLADGHAAACSASSATRELDYWLGDWKVTMPGNQGSGTTSKVTLALDKCVIVESWNDGKGHVGENRFAYNYEHKTWGGLFVDNNGHVHVFTDGKVATGTAEFHGPVRSPNGDTTLHRIRITRRGPNQVEQLWEKSVDDGATWSTVFRGEYIRKSP